MVTNVNVVVFLCCLSVANAFFFNRRVNCLVTNWSPWSDPDENGQRERTCKILRLPENGGRPCPHIREVKDENRNSTSWSTWSPLFGFGQRSRTRLWTETPYLARNEHTYRYSSLMEEDIRYTGLKLGLGYIADSFNKIFIHTAAEIPYEPTDGDENSYDPTDEEQLGKVRDIVLILDSSGSIGITNFNKAKEDAKSLFGLLCPQDGPFDVNDDYQYQNHQLAMLTFSTAVRENFYFNTYNRTSSVLNAITRAKYLGRKTNTTGAFRIAKEMFKKNRGARGSPSYVKQEVLILTDGLSNTGGDAVAAAKELSKVADVYGLMIGSFSASGMEELTEYVSKPASNHLFNLKGFRKLTDLVEILKIYARADPNWCQGLDG